MIYHNYSNFSINRMFSIIIRQMNVAKNELFALVLNLLSTDSGIFMGFLDFASFLDCPFMF